MPRITRRQLAAVITATPLLAQAPTRPESPPAPPSTAGANPTDVPADPLEKARQQARRNSEALAKVDIAMSVEPSFAFKP